MVKKFNYFMVMVFFLASTVSVFAQEDDLPEPPPGAPINKYILLLGIVGSIFMWKYLIKRTSSPIKG